MALQSSLNARLFQALFQPRRKPVFVSIHLLCRKRLAFAFSQDRFWRRDEAVLFCDAAQDSQLFFLCLLGNLVIFRSCPVEVVSAGYALEFGAGLPVPDSPRRMGRFLSHNYLFMYCKANTKKACRKTNKLSALLKTRLNRSLIFYKLLVFNVLDILKIF